MSLRPARSDVTVRTREQAMFVGARPDTAKCYGDCGRRRRLALPLPSSSKRKPLPSP